MDFIAGLRLELVIITNESSSADLNEVKEMVKNVKSASLINKNVLAVTTILTVMEIKELKAQIFELKAKLKDSKYVSREDHKSLSNTKENRKPSYKGLNCKSVNKRNLECYKCDKKGYFKSECQLKLKD